jgi:hypothetical protein
MMTLASSISDASLNYDAIVFIYDRNMFIIQATAVVKDLWTSQAELRKLDKWDDILFDLISTSKSSFH